MAKKQKVQKSKMNYPLLISMGQTVSFADLEVQGIEIGDDGKEQAEAESLIHNEYLLGLLTRRQQEVAKLLAEGYSRKEIASQRATCLQAVHQIVLRIRARLRSRTKLQYGRGNR